MILLKIEKQDSATFIHDIKVYNLGINKKPCKHFMYNIYSL